MWTPHPTWVIGYYQFYWSPICPSLPGLRGNHSAEMCASDSFVPHNFTACVSCVIFICPPRCILQSSPSCHVPHRGLPWSLASWWVWPRWWLTRDQSMRNMRPGCLLPCPLPAGSPPINRLQPSIRDRQLPLHAAVHPASSLAPSGQDGKASWLFW